MIIYLTYMEKYGIIYKVTNKINNKTYIGQTTSKRGFNSRYSYGGTNIEKIYAYHLYRKLKNTFYNKELLEDIEKYGIENFEVNQELDKAYSKEELDQKEKMYIEKNDSYNNGYNLTEGGHCYKLSDETKKKISKSRIERGVAKGEKNPQYGKRGKLSPNYGKHHSEETKKRIGTSGKGKHNHNEEVRLKISKAHKGKATWNAVPIIQKDNEENVVKIWRSTCDASLHTNINKESIRKCCKGKQKTAGGYKWSYYKKSIS